MTKATGPLFSVHFGRRRKAVTDYATRLALLKSAKPRVSVRKTNRFVLVQVLEYHVAGDKTLVTASSRELAKFGFPGKCNTPSAYLTGLLAGKRAKAKGVTAGVADLGRQTSSKGSLLFAALKGFADSGVKLPLGEEVVPAADRITGSHLKGEVKAAFEKAKSGILNG